MSVRALDVTVAGADGLGRRLGASKDAVRESVKKALRRFGQDVVAGEKVLAPRSKDYRSPGSKKIGPLSKSIKAKLRANAPDRSISIDIRPLPFYALFVEGGVTRQRFRTNHINAIGERGHLREVVMNRGYIQGSKQKTGTRQYRGYAVVGEHQRRTAIKDDYGATIGTKFQTIKARHVGPYTWKKTTHIAGREFVRPVWNALKGGVPDRIRDAVREALGASGVN